ncbi:MAG: TIGR03905 family TSCPD domain-containing protein [Rikenellaceae bacterium]|nr:TIGR03905 family TSCPD domain-containing protein [Rikenellaceae bacterium]
MKKTITYTTQGTCSQAIIVTVEDQQIVEVSFLGGCHGNTQGVAALVRGMAIEEAIKQLEGIDCRGRGTSCPDQLAKALRQCLEA